MQIIAIIVVLVIVGLVLYLINNYLPIAESVKKALNVVVVLGLCLWLINTIGMMFVPPAPK